MSDGIQRMKLSFSQLLPTLLASTLIGCGPSDVNQTEQRIQIETAPEVEAISPDILEAETDSEPSSLELDTAPELYLKPNQFAVGCGEEISFEAIEISAQCGTDEDKDGYLDDTAATVTFKNTSRRPFQLTFGSRVHKYHQILVGGDVPPFFVQEPSREGVRTTVEIPANEIFRISEQASDPEALFKYTLYGGAVEYTTSEQEVVSLACDENSRGLEEKVFGVRLYLVCISGELVVENEAKGDMRDSKVGSRNVVVRPNYSSVDVVYTLPEFSAYGRESVILYSNPDDSYEIEVSIP